LRGPNALHRDAVAVKRRRVAGLRPGGPFELANCAAMIFGIGSRFGNMTRQMRNFLDRTGALWVSGAPAGIAQYQGRHVTQIATQLLG
jgi:hypothetical protein